MKGLNVSLCAGGGTSVLIGERKTHTRTEQMDVPVHVNTQQLCLTHFELNANIGMLAMTALIRWCLADITFDHFQVQCVSMLAFTN